MLAGNFGSSRFLRWQLTHQPILSDGTWYTTFIFSTHDPRVMGRAHRVLRLADGRIEA